MTQLNRVSDLRELAMPPGNRLERLIGSRRGQHGSETEILADFPDLEAADFSAIYAFASDRERRLVADTAAA